MKTKLTLLLFCLHLGFGADCLAASEPASGRPAEPRGPAIVPGATESSPSRSQYFSWINNRNEGSTEAQTLANLEFFKWLHDEYGMQLDIYAFDAGNIDGPQYYGRTDSDKFKAQFPRGFAPIYERAKSFGCRLGVWLGPDGFGDTPAEEQARINMLVGLCRDYHFELFKMDAVCGQLRPEKQEAFARLMTECRKYSPDLILLNHRLKLGSAQDYATTFLWEGAETYIDVHMANWSRAGTHNRVQAISRSLVPDLRRLTEDCGVCLSSCLDYWDDDLILQAFNRCLILAPELYGNPWFLRDDEFPRLARIFNLHQRYRDIMVKGMVLDAERYGPLAVARGNEATRLVTLRNLGWEPVVRRLKLDVSIGFTGGGPVEVRQFHPCERILGTFKPGDEVAVEVLPFRSCLLLVDAKQTGGVGLRGCDYEVVRDVPRKDVVIRMFGQAGATSEVSLVSNGRAFRQATIDGQPMPELPTGKTVRIQFPGKPDSAPWHRRIGAPTVCAVPADAETLFESSCFAGDNDPLELRSLRRSGPSKIPAVQKARQAFLEQPIIAEQGMLSDSLFDGNSVTFCDLLKTRARDPGSRCLRLDLGKAARLDHLLLVPPATGALRYAAVTPTNHAEVSVDLKTWTPARPVQDGRNIRIECDPTQPFRYLRTDLVPDKLVEIRGFSEGKELDRGGWRASWLFPRFQKVCQAWSLPFSLDAAAPGSYLTVACNGVHGREGTWVALRVDGRCVGAPQRAPSYPVNPWEYPVSPTDRNYSYFVPVTQDMLGKACEVVVLAFDPKNLEFIPDVWLTAYPVPYQEKTLTLSERAEAPANAPVYYRQAKKRKPEMRECEVAVYGGTPAGVTAAIAAGRMGRKTLLLSFNRHVGGLTSGGLTATDLGKKGTIGGLALDFYTRLGRNTDFSPSAAETLYRTMLDEAGVTVLLERCLESVEMKANRIVSATFETGETVKASVFVDATYEGDLMAAANVSYRVGREPRSAFGETLAGQWQSVSWKDVYQFCRLPISPYRVPEDPSSGLLPEISPHKPGAPGEGDYRVQAYNFRLQLSDKEGRVPFPRPAGYDPARYALLARFLNFDPNIEWKLGYTTKPMTDGPVQLRPGDSNNAGSFSSDYVDGNHRWPDGTFEPVSFAALPPPRRGLPVPLRELYPLRQKIFQDHVTYQQGLLYFLANDLQVPKELQERVRKFGLDPNEFQETSHWPHQLYVREGRRMVSDYIMTQENCESKRTAEDSVGLASYPMDSHFCQRVVVEESGKTTVRNEGGFGHGFPKPYPVSYRAIVPKEQECANLLVPVCLSASHAAYGSIRMEPVFMILGQSAGTAAAIAIDKGLAVQQVDYKELKRKLMDDGQKL